MSIFICQFCGRETTNTGANAKHEKHCKSNPNYVKAYRSPKAGQPKGSIPWNKGRTDVGLTDYHKSIRLDNSEVFVVNSTYARNRLKARIIKEEMIPYVCACCGIGPEWMGKPMTLILDHINGVNNDNRLENLRFVCSNCDSQLPTYKSRNRR